ncbi:unnamed protein product [Cylicocyclus nassatus]|uniref:Uncharacterized protein n=1 Tax=Cylicocyclus nassatus TaxID=53992 RepID=A0AA36DM97_CYLNA|nr:unnamed protein product [Cylicocyclus nassatus]
MLVEELSNLCGIDGCIFVHVRGFIGGNKAFEGALAMAKKALEIGDAENELFFPNFCGMCLDRCSSNCLKNCQPQRLCLKRFRAEQNRTYKN